MTEHSHAVLVRALSRLAAASILALAMPAVAGHGYHAYPGQAGHGTPPCHAYPGHHPGMQGHGACPHMKQDAGPARMQGKTLGVMISDLPNAIMDASGAGYGVNVEQVMPDSAAAQAGIKAGDLITEFAGSPVYSTDRLRWLVRKAEPGKTLDIKLLREGQVTMVSATLQAPPAPKEKCKMDDKSRLGT